MTNFKRSFCVIIMLSMLLVAVVFSACDMITTLQQSDLEYLNLYSMYKAYAEETEIPVMSYQEWLETIKGEKGDPGIDGQDGVGIEKIEKTSTEGNVDTYTITLTNGNTFIFTVTNGVDGEKGEQGAGCADCIGITNVESSYCLDDDCRVCIKFVYYYSNETTTESLLPYISMDGSSLYQHPFRWETTETLHWQVLTCGHEAQINPAEHLFENGICSTCGYQCKHSSQYGPCDFCGFICEHTFDEEGICTKCGYERDLVHTLDIHGCCTETLASGEACSYQDKDKCTDHSDCDLYGKCNYCGKKYSGFVCENHVYVDGKCQYCGEAEPMDIGSLLNEPITIRFYHTMGEYLRNVLDSYLEEFMAMYPNITVEHTQVGGYDDVRNQIKTEINTGAQPNLAYCYADHVANYNISGAVATLDDYINSTDYVFDANGNEHVIGLTQDEIADFIPGFWNEGKQYGTSKMYTLPFSKSTEVLYYNKTFFNENNIPVPTHWWCDADICGNCNKSSMEAVCARIKEIDNTSIPLGYDNESNWFITMCEQLGSPYTAARGENYLFDNATNRDFVKRFASWYKKGWLTTQELYGSYTSNLLTQTAADQPKSYMSIASSAGATHQRPYKEVIVNGVAFYPFDVGIAAIPQANAAAPKAISQGPSICMFAKDNKAEELATWLLMKYLTTNVDFQVEFAFASGYMPVLQSVTDTSKADYEKDENGEYVLDANGEKIPNAYMLFQNKLAAANGGDNIAYLSLKVAMEQRNSCFSSPAFNGSFTTRKQVGSLMTTCLVMDPNASDIDAQIKMAFEKAVAECKAVG